MKQKLSFICWSQIVRTLQNFKSGMEMKETYSLDWFRKICLKFKCLSEIAAKGKVYIVSEADFL